MFRRLFFFSPLSLLVFAFSAPWVKQMHHFSVKKKKSLLPPLSLPLCHFRVWKCSLPLIFFPARALPNTSCFLAGVISLCLSPFNCALPLWQRKVKLPNWQWGEGCDGKKNWYMNSKVSAIDFFLMQMETKRGMFKAAESLFDHHYSRANVVAMLLVVRRKARVFICALHCFVVHCVVAQPLMPCGQKAY